MSNQIKTNVCIKCNGETIETGIKVRCNARRFCWSRLQQCTESGYCYRQTFKYIPTSASGDLFVPPNSIYKTNCGEITEKLKKGEFTWARYFRNTTASRWEQTKTLNFSRAVKIGRFIGWYYGKVGKKCKIVIGGHKTLVIYVWIHFQQDLRLEGRCVPYALQLPECFVYNKNIDFDCGIMISKP